MCVWHALQFGACSSHRPLCQYGVYGRRANSKRPAGQAWACCARSRRYHLVSTTTPSFSHCAAGDVQSRAVHPTTDHTAAARAPRSAETGPVGPVLPRPSAGGCSALGGDARWGQPRAGEWVDGSGGAGFTWVRVGEARWRGAHGSIASASSGCRGAAG